MRRHPRSLVVKVDARLVIVGFVAAVLGADVHLIRGGQLTVSGQCAKWCSTKRGRLTVTAVLGYLFCHLTDWPKWMRRVDPLNGLGAVVRRNLCAHRIGS